MFWGILFDKLDPEQQAFFYNYLLKECAGMQ